MSLAACSRCHGVQQVQLPRKLGRGQHPERDCFPVGQPDIGSGNFEGMSKGVSEIQDSAQVRLSFILRRHLGLDLTTAGDHLLQSVLSSGQQIVEVGFKEREEAGVINEAVLDDFVKTGLKLTIGQGRERCGIDQDQARLMKRPHQVFPLLVVDSRFPTY